MGVFGCVARGSENDFSDIDLLVEFENPTPDTMPERYLGLLNALEEKFSRTVQVLTPRMVRNPFLKKSIERDITYVYG